MPYALFDGRLSKHEHIRKYLVRRGPQSKDIVVGALTNLKTWHVYVAGRHVLACSGERLLQLVKIEVCSRKDITHLGRLIGCRGNGALRAVRASLGESPQVIKHILMNDPEVHKAIRRSLVSMQECHAIEAHVPQNHSLRKWIIAFLKGNREKYNGWSPAKLKQVLGCRLVVGQVNKKLQEQFGSRSRHGKVRKTIRGILDASEFSDDFLTEAA